MNSKKVEDEIKAAENKISKDVISHIVTSVSQGTNPSPVDLIGYVGLLGDIGAEIQDSYNRKPDPKKAYLAPMIAAFDTLSGGKLKAYSNAIYATRSPDVYLTKPNPKLDKKAERNICEGVKNPTTKLFPGRSGVFDLGIVADGGVLPKPNPAIPPLGWPLQTVPMKLYTACPEEPWAGHFSGSLYEILLMLDLLTAQDPTQAATPTNKVDRDAKAAIASAFLVATGMHTAIEEVYVIKEFLSTAIAFDLKVICAATATKYISELITRHHKMKRRLK